MPGHEDDWMPPGWLESLDAMDSQGSENPPKPKEHRTKAKQHAPAKAKPRGSTKAAVVRQIIAQARARKGTSQDSVVDAVVKSLGMVRSMAQVYVRNNWDKA